MFLPYCKIYSACQVSLVSLEFINVPFERQKGWNPSIWSFLSLLVGALLLIVSSGFIFISIPLFLASFALSIIAVARRRIISGIGMMILIFTVAPACIFGAFARELSKRHPEGLERKVRSGSYVGLADLLSLDRSQIYKNL